MSIKVPEKLSKQEFHRLIDKKLHNSDFQEYEKMVRESYKRPKGESDYILKEELSDETLILLDFIFKRIGKKEFDSLEEISGYFRRLLERKKYIMLFAYNGTGKTRLSVEFKKQGDTLYYNAFTEDLFHWHNEHDFFLEFNNESSFFAGVKELEMESRIRSFLDRYENFGFTIDYDGHRIYFYRDVVVSGISQRIDNIKISRGEEKIFIWCFFLAIVQLVVDKQEAYQWVKYIYIDDPISSLDDNNAIAVASHLAAVVSGSDIKVIISSHHTLFYNVLCNEIDKPEQLFFQKKAENEGYILKDTSKTPFFHHIALLKELKEASDSGRLYTYHFNILRNILEKTASFHGYAHFSSCLRKGDDENSLVYTRIVNLLSHGNYNVFEPKEMVEENKEYFRMILSNFIEDYKFNPKVFEAEQAQEEME
ncbi:MAG: AAA family ATPase [Hungatella sp.]|nr:AAA family ATPase [Hungatella sp.]